MTSELSSRGLVLVVVVFVVVVVVDCEWYQGGGVFRGGACICPTLGGEKID